MAVAAAVVVEEAVGRGEVVETAAVGVVEAEGGVAVAGK